MRVGEFDEHHGVDGGVVFLLSHCPVHNYFILFLVEKRFR